MTLSAGLSGLELKVSTEINTWILRNPLPTAFPDLTLRQHHSAFSGGYSFSNARKPANLASGTAAFLTTVFHTAGGMAAMRMSAASNVTSHWGIGTCVGGTPVSIELSSSSAVRPYWIVAGGLQSSVTLIFYNRGKSYKQAAIAVCTSCSWHA